MILWKTIFFKGLLVAFNSSSWVSVVPGQKTKQKKIYCRLFCKGSWRNLNIGSTKSSECNSVSFQDRQSNTDYRSIFVCVAVTFLTHNALKGRQLLNKYPKRTQIHPKILMTRLQPKHWSPKNRSPENPLPKISNTNILPAKKTLS